MMHGSEWTLKYDEPEVEMSHDGAMNDRASYVLSYSQPLA